MDGIVWEFDVATLCFTFVSEKAERLLGYPLEAWLQPRFWIRILHPEDRDAAVRYCVDRTQRMEPHDFEYRVLARDGRVVWLRDLVSVVVSEGRPVSLRGIMVDITAQKDAQAERERLLVEEQSARAAAEEALRARLALEDQLSKMAVSVPGLIFSFRHLPDGSACFPFTTPAVEDVLGFSQGALATDGAPFQARLHPDDARRFAGALDESTSSMTRFHGEFRYSHPTKGLRWLELWCVPKAEAGESILWHGFLTDVTDRKQADARLRLFARVVETSSDFIGICTPEMRPVFLNEAGRRMVGLDSMEDVRRTVVMDYFWPEERPRIASEAIPTLVREGRWSGEVRFRHFRTGAPIPTLWNAFVVKDDAGAPVAWATVSPDLTEQKRAEEELREANTRLAEADRRKDEFLGVLSHELRNPLAAIHSATYVLHRVPPGSKEAVNVQQIIQRQTDHLARIVDDLLDMTRISHGRIELRRIRVDLREVVVRCFADHGALFEQAQVHLRHDLPATPVWIDADSTRIAQVLGNLLQNAAKFTAAGGVVFVQVAAREGAAELSVRDTGIGMDVEELDRIFEPFAQAVQGLARTRGGLGLGLALSKGLVELHGGSIRARSDGLGRGSEFLVRLPLAPAPVVSLPAPQTRTRAERRLVLLIEDNVDTCEALSLALGLTGHDIRTAHDGKTGIAAAHELKPDIVLCDIGLPDIEGYEVARRMRADDALRSTRLVALSGYARPEDKARATEAGFDAHVAKPPELEELAEVLAKA